MIKKLTDIPCRYAEHGCDWVDYGSTRVSMPSFECTYDGDKEIPDDCKENESCPGYKPVKTEVCKEHDREYIGFCWECADECEDRMERERMEGE